MSTKKIKKSVKKKAKNNPNNEKPLKINIPFDEAIKKIFEKK